MIPRLSASAQPRSHRALRAVPLCAALLLIACYGQMPLARSATLRVVALPATTTVYVDGQYFGSARVLAKHGKSIGPGLRLVTFMAPGHFPHDVELKLKPGQTTIRMQLLPIPP
jgi:hypothetical protein